MKSQTNRLIIIGNGFDLAHGLKTSYSDFIEDYATATYERLRVKGRFGDKLWEINPGSKPIALMKVNRCDLKGIIGMLKSGSEYSATYHSRYFESLCEKLTNCNWVDIEHHYYRHLCKIFNSRTKDNELIRKLNDDFEIITEMLSAYIHKVNGSIRQSDWTITSNSKRIRRVFDNSDSRLLALNFNYTDTLEILRYFDSDEIVNIHGRVSRSESEPIIFGYGDESDATYPELESTGDNFYLQHIKSFRYLLSNHYPKLMGFIDVDPYEVHLLGHSCGLSDRVLLKEIFEHKNCREINVYFYRNGSWNNFTETTQNISRHFSPANKGAMRRKIKPFNSENEIPQYLLK